MKDIFGENIALTVVIDSEAFYNKRYVVFHIIFFCLALTCRLTTTAQQMLEPSTGALKRAQSLLDLQCFIFKPLSQE